jgi:hypothetical protein
MPFCEVGYRSVELKKIMKEIPPCVDAQLVGKSAIVSAQIHETERDVVAAGLPHAVIPGFAPVMIDPKFIPDQIAGFKHRVGRDTPPVRLNILQYTKEFVKRFPKLDHVDEFEDWLSKTTYAESRKKQLRKCHDNLAGGKCTKKQSSKIKSFVKREGYPEFKYARWINSRSDYFKVYSGPAFKNIEEVVFRDHHFIKHVPVADRPALISALVSTGARYFATDYTSFEAHFVPEVMRQCECVLYTHMLQDFPELAQEINSVITGMNCGSTRQGTRFQVEGRRMSGDMCTSLGNGFTNLLLWSYLCDKNGCKWEGYVEGDDGIFAVAGQPPTQAQFADLGFTIKILEHSDPRTASFCGIVSVDDTAIKDPIEWLGNFGWTMTMPSAGFRIKNKLLRAKALSAVFELPNCPIISPIARWALARTRGYKALFINDGYHNMPHDELKICPYEPTMQVRTAFADKYNIPITRQLEIEEKLKQISDLSELVDMVEPSFSSHYCYYNYVYNKEKKWPT